MLVFIPRGVPTPEETKRIVVDKIKNEGISVRDACALYKVQPKGVYKWLHGEIVDSDGESSRNLALENNRLKKELEIAYRILGRLTAEASSGKK